MLANAYICLVALSQQHREVLSRYCCVIVSHFLSQNHHCFRRVEISKLCGCVLFGSMLELTAYERESVIDDMNVEDDAMSPLQEIGEV